MYGFARDYLDAVKQRTPRVSCTAQSVDRLNLHSEPKARYARWRQDVVHLPHLRYMMTNLWRALTHLLPEEGRTLVAARCHALRLRSEVRMKEEEGDRRKTTVAWAGAMGTLCVGGVGCCELAVYLLQPTCGRVFRLLPAAFAGVLLLAVWRLQKCDQYRLDPHQKWAPVEKGNENVEF